MKDTAVCGMILRHETTGGDSLREQSQMGEDGAVLSGAQVIGSAVIPGYRLLFGQSMTGACATIAQDANCCVHAPVCRIPAEDEVRPDSFEGYPNCCRKRESVLPVSKTGGRM